MKRDSGKRGLVLRFDIRKKMLSQLTWEEWGHLIDLALIYADPQDPEFEKPPDLDAEFPGMDGDRARLYRQSWELLAADAREDDERLVYKNSRRNYSAFCTNAKRWGRLSDEDILPYEEWHQIGEPGWRQWDRLGRPMPPVKPLKMNPDASADRNGPNDTVTEPFDTVTVPTPITITTPFPPTITVPFSPTTARATPLRRPSARPPLSLSLPR